ncbi:hypothetical protein [Bacillus sp. 1P06AnD]|uniref:hypothetical protein n=1 Tax=Bacillus sp. 1P06AnD TaxID=3132208 RepID=UPI0039A1FF30
MYKWSYLFIVSALILRGADSVLYMEDWYYPMGVIIVEWIVVFLTGIGLILSFTGKLTGNKITAISLNLLHVFFTLILFANVAILTFGC